MRSANWGGSTATRRSPALDADLRPWSVEAVNLPDHADNPIHTDEGARAAGFRSALVAGTTVHAYLTRPVVEAWGTGWLAGGASMVEFLAPVEAGDRVDCVPGPDPDGEAGDGSVEVRGEVAGDLRARLVAHRSCPEGFLEDVPDGRVPGGEPLPVHVEVVDGPRADYASRAGDDLGLYDEHGLVHPCIWTTLANAVMVRHLVDPPWIHTRSRVVHHRTLALDAPMLVEATVVDRFETRRGSRAVVDVSVSSDGDPVATVRHEALVSLRSEAPS